VPFPALRRPGKTPLPLRLLRSAAQPSRPWHPLRSALAPVLKAATRAQKTKAGRVLLVCRSSDILLRAIPTATDAISPEHLLLGTMSEAHASCFDLCIVQLASGEMRRAQELYNAILPRMRNDGKVVLLWINFELAPFALWQEDLTKALVVRAPGVKIWYTRTRIGALSLRFIHRLTQYRSSRALRMALRIAGAPASMALAVMANLSPQNHRDGPASPCTAIRFEIDIERKPPHSGLDMASALASGDARSCPERGRVRANL